MNDRQSIVAESSPSRPIQTARLAGVGVGPGDPELLTLKAARAIERADVVFAPTRRAGGQSMAVEIAQAHVDEQRQTVVTLPFPDVSPGGSWDAIASQIVETLGTERHGVFLTEGDPSLFGSFGHVAAAIRRIAPTLTIAVVPGVSSVTAAAAAAGIALTDYHERLAIVPASADLAEIEQALRSFECVVILKVGSVLGALIALLDRLKLSDQAVYVRRCGWPDQQIVTDVGSLVSNPPADYFALLIVRRR